VNTTPRIANRGYLATIGVQKLSGNSTYIATALNDRTGSGEVDAPNFRSFTDGVYTPPAGSFTTSLRTGTALRFARDNRGNRVPAIE
jgi:hypothetical protein